MFANQVALQCWPEKHDGATAVVMVNDIDAVVNKWAKSLQLRDVATC